VSENDKPGDDVGKAAADGLLGKIANDPGMKDALEQLDRSRRTLGTSNIEASVTLLCSLNGEGVPVTFVISVGDHEALDF
jgi:hypothetical protein